MNYDFYVIGICAILTMVICFRVGRFFAIKERLKIETELKDSKLVLERELKLLTGSLDVVSENSKRYQLICHILENQTPLCLEIGYNGKLLTTALELDLVLDGIIDIHEQQQLIDFLTALKKGLE